MQDYGRSIFPDQRPAALNANAPDVTEGVYLDIHSYGELVLWPWGFTYSSAPNEVDLQTLGRKLAYFTDYYPEQAVGLYPTDGATDDFFYGDLGVAAYTIEVGTMFFQSCSTFNNQILPDNLDSLLYAAKTARAPYQLPAGPEVTSLELYKTTVFEGYRVTLTARLDDTRYNSLNGSEPTQVIGSAAATIDVPPWESGAVNIPLLASDGAFDSPIESIVGRIDTSGLAPGRHIIYVHGADADGNWGVVSALFLEVFPSDKTWLPTIIKW